ncbi:phosphotransferase [Nocardioides marinquilinus]|uniref:Maltokinase n=1 Tax=Nocardioides marinquilinus TaxID=1210400 RepID=A0ABP9PRQ2_9ACTN
MTDPNESTPREAIAPYLAKTRWFGGKGRDFEVGEVRRVATLGDGDPWVDVLVVELRYADGDVEHYQVPLTLYTDPERRLDHAFLGWWEDAERGWVHAYDALHDREATRLWLLGFVAAREADSGAGGTAEVGGLTFHRLPGYDLDVEAVGSLFSGEQSNSSVLFGEDSILKLFRKVTPGANPDVTVHDVLTRAGSTHVAHLYGWVAAGEGADEVHLGMLQQFLRTATDGWDLALSSIRDLYADPEMAAREAGGDFSGEAGRLGEALREVHDTLRAELPVDTSSAPSPAAVAAAMNRRLDAALGVVEGLGAHAETLRSVYDALARLDHLEVQTVHGDLHLGQTLRTALGWKIVDFEGEPAKTLAERLEPDSPWRDVAGMLRSFDYAPHVVEQQQADWTQSDDESLDERRARGLEWAERNQRYFLAAYAGGDLSDEQDLLVHAYLADKAVYEAVYEARNRPDWVGIPLAGVARIGAR